MRKLIITLVFVASVFGQTKVGTSAAHFLGIGVGAKAVGMGGAFTSHATDASVMYWNPGALSRLESSQAQFTRADWLVDTDLNFISAAFKVGNNNAIGLMLILLNYGKEEITSLDFQEGTGLYWTASDIVAGVAFSRNLTQRFSIGSMVKLIQQNIHNETASTVAMDIGLKYLSSNEKYKIGMCIANFGPDMSMDGKDLYHKIDIDPEVEGHNETIVAKLKVDEWPLPLFFRVGLSVDLIQSKALRWTIAADALIPGDDAESLHFGTELALGERVFLRTGYKFIDTRRNEEGLAIGFGIKAFSLNGIDLMLDGAYQDFGIFGYVPHFGISMNF